MTKTYKASVKYNGQLQIMTMEFNSKAEFADQLRRNGYKVQFISTPEKFDEDTEKYYMELEKRAFVSKMMRQADKRRAERKAAMQVA